MTEADHDAQTQGQTTSGSGSGSGGGERAAGAGDVGSVARLRREAEAARVLLAAISADVGDDPEAVRDAVEGETDLIEAVEAAIDKLAELDSFMLALKAREDNFAARRQRFEARQMGIKRAIAEALEVMGQRKLELASATVYTSKGRRRAIVTDPTQIPSEYLIPQPAKVDMTSLAKALAEHTVPGAELSNASIILNIRTR